MSRIEPIVPDSCCISPRFRSNSFRRSFRYKRLPPQLLRLSVLKLDGSSFEVQVARTATVAALRGAVESVFCGMSMNKEDVKISWPHVWSHFCLCYKHYKLIDDKLRIKRFGIRDGDQDQVHFVCATQDTVVSFLSIQKLCALEDRSRRNSNCLKRRKQKNGNEDAQVI